MGIKLIQKDQNNIKKQKNKKQSWRTHKSQFQTNCQARLCGTGIKIEI